MELYIRNHNLKENQEQYFETFSQMIIKAKCMTLMYLH